MNMKNVVNMYSANFKVVFIQNYVFNTKNEMNLNMNLDSLRFFRVNMNCNSTIQAVFQFSPQNIFNFYANKFTTPTIFFRNFDNDVP